MTFNKLLMAMCVFLGLSSGLFAGNDNFQNAREINELKQKIVKMKTVDSESHSINEKYYRHKLAISQVKAVKKVAAYETYMFLAKHGTKRSMSEINQIVDVAWECAWIFPDIGPTPMERFKTILEWCKMETNFKAKLVSKWKAGQYIKSLDKYVRKDTEDWGPWQINTDNFAYAQNTYRLYKSGIVPFKIIKIRKYEDLYDIPTNCVVRCAIETDRREAGLDWRHHSRSKNDKDYVAHISKKIKELEKEGLYDERLVYYYYKLTPIKKYSNKN